MAESSQLRLGRYELKERIGAGGTARVYKAFDPTLGRLVAIKVLYEHLAEDSAFLERFEREAMIVASFNHPNIVQVFDFSVEQRETGALCYMVMSYIPGQTLRAILEDAARTGQRIPDDRILSIMRNLADALGYAHAHGMVHRDVKPGNVIVREDGLAVLTDFGIARLIRAERLTQQGTTTGTPVYMSPEQAAGDPGDARSDLYSLGIILYEMLAGRPPFDDENTLSVMFKHLNSPVPRLADTGTLAFPKADVFFSRALAKEPEDRFQTAGEFSGGLRTIFGDGDQPTTVVPIGSLALKSETAGRDVARRTTAGLQVPSRTAPVTGVLALVGLAGLLTIILVIALSRANSLEITETDSAGTASMPGDIYFTSEFAQDEALNEYWLQTQSNALEAEITPTGFFRLVNSLPNTAATRIFSLNALYETVSIAMEARLEEGSQRASAYGIVFHYHDEDNYSVFAVDGVGRFSIWTRANGVWQELRGEAEEWTDNAAVKPVGEPNRLAVTILNGQFTAYVNNRRVTRVSDSTFKDGRIGIYIATDNGDATVLVDQYRVFSSVPSMTSPTG
ncbi:MAG: protein kinase [Chloroflexi bacterium]|nr:protein kinase [Chloroflexota bacterium]